jgi:hypothetical protein
LTKYTPPGYTVKVNEKNADVKTMLMRKLYISIILAMLAVAATVVLSPEAQAMGAACCCPAESCGCGCTQHGQEEPVAAFEPFGTDDAGTCSCSTGSNPFGMDESAAAVCLDPPKKRFLQPLASAADGVCFAPEGTSPKRYKPPAVTQRCLYILKSSFLI